LTIVSRRNARAFSDATSRVSGCETDPRSKRRSATIAMPPAEGKQRVPFPELGKS
jgi:hypothetical protein